MRQKWRLVALAGLLSLGALLRAPALLSSGLGNAGLAALSRAMATHPYAASAEVVPRAEGWLKQALAWDEANLGARLGLGWALTLQGKDTEAAAQWRAAGLTARDLIAEGDQARRAGSYDEAMAWYERVALLEPGLQSTVLYLQYLTHEASGNTDLALMHLQEAISLDQGWLDLETRFLAWHLWGVSLHEQHRQAEAESALWKAIALYPGVEQLQRTLSNTYRFLGLSQRNQGNLEGALQSLATSVRLNAGNPWARIQFGQTLYKHDARRAPEAEREFSVALSLEPDDIRIWRSVIRFWRQNGETGRADSLCLEARERGFVSGLEEVCPSR
jgi:tetratricopeptide (TPR) repeat protein